MVYFSKKAQDVAAAEFAAQRAVLLPNNQAAPILPIAIVRIQSLQQPAKAVVYDHATFFDPE